MDALWGEALTDEFLADDLAKLARRHLVDDGYMNARVTVTTVESTRDRLALTMSIEPGDQVKTRAVVFSGNTVFKDADLLAVLREGDLERSVWYDPETLEQPLATLYRRQGYLDVEIDTSSVRVVGTRAELPVTVTEGRPYNIASIDVRGARARPLPELQRIIGLTPGSQLRVDELRAARLRLQTFYVEQGYDEADVRVQRTVDRESATVVAVFNVTEGQRRVVDDLRIVGNQETLTKIISDFANLQAGTPVTSALVSDLQKRLYDTGVFTSVAVTFEPVKAPPPAAAGLTRHGRTDSGARRHRRTGSRSRGHSRVRRGSSPLLGTLRRADDEIARGHWHRIGLRAWRRRRLPRSEPVRPRHRCRHRRPRRSKQSERAGPARHSAHVRQARSGPTCSSMRSRITRESLGRTGSMNATPAWFSSSERD